ncbi:hypothetical protein PENTCL1PPCAC_1034, partial [Pristionchus entomophagus]
RGQNRKRENNDVNEREKRKKNDDEDKPSEILPIEQAYDFGDEDYLSRLPNLCLLKIFTLLPRSDIYSMSLMNKRIRPITNDRSLDRIKCKGGKLAIFQTESGYGFRFMIKDRCKPLNAPTMYLYDICNADCSFRERKRTNSYHGEYSLCPYTTYPYYHDWPIPELFFVALHDLLRHREVHYMKIKQVPMNSSCLSDKLPVLLDGHNIGHALIDCNDMYDPVLEGNRKRYTQLMNSARKASMWIDSSTGSKVLINAETIVDIIESNLQEYHEDIAPHSDDVYAERFDLQESMVSRISRFDWLDAPAMTLDATRVAGLCKSYLDTREPSPRGSLGQWRFNTDQRLTDQIIIPHMQASDYEYNGPTPTVDHFIVSKMGDKIATLRLFDWTVDGQPLHEVQVRFRINASGEESKREKEGEELMDEEEEEEEEE